MREALPPPIPSDSDQGRHRHWLLAGLWWALCLPATLAVPGELARGNTPILAVLALDAIGLYLIHLAIREYRARSRYGPSPLFLQRHPARTGQPLAGEIHFSRPLPADADIRVTLSRVRYTATGSGSTYRSSRTIEWQDRQAVTAETNAAGTTLRFHFELPAGGPASESPSSHYRYWELVLNAPDLRPGLMRVYPITVVAGKADAPRASAPKPGSGHRHDISAAAGMWSLRRFPGGLERREGFRDNWRTAMLNLPFGLGFAGGGLALWRAESLGVLKWLFVIPFGTVGALISFYGLALLLGSRQLRLTRGGIQTRYSLLGLPVRRKKIPAGEFGRLQLRRTGQVNRQGESVHAWAVMAENRAGTLQLPVIENLESRRAARQAMSWLSVNGPFVMPSAEDDADEET